MRVPTVFNLTLASVAIVVPVAASPAYAETVQISNQAAYDQYRNATFKAGDKILFKRGQRFVGQFAPKGSGTPENPIVVDAYGEGALPELGGDVIGERNNSGIILLVNQQGWEFRNLSISNGKVGDIHSGYRSGILFFADKPGTYNHFRIENCRFHDIYGAVGFNPENGQGAYVGKHNAAIMFLVTQQNGEVRVADLAIEKNDFYMVARQAIATRSLPEFVPGAKAFRTDPEGRFDGVFVRHNKIMRTAADSVMISNPLGAVIEHNVVGEVGVGWDQWDVRVKGASKGLTRWSREPFNGLWAYNGSDILIQHNEVYGIADKIDGTAFGVDRNSYGTIIQHNYSHDNNGGFYSTFGSSSNTIVRNNISYNDHQRLMYFGFHETHDRVGTRLTNNLFVTPVGESVTAFYGSNVYAPIFDRNMIVNRGSMKWISHVGNPQATGPKKISDSPWLKQIERRGFEEGIVARNNRFVGSGIAGLPEAASLSEAPANLPKDAPLGIANVRALFKITEDAPPK